MRIPLSTWAARNFAPAPSIRTLRGWCKAGWIHPAPVKVGRTYMVDEHAEYCPSSPPVTATQHLSERARAILHDTAA